MGAYEDQYALLISELADDPEGLGYAAMDDYQVIDSMIAMTLPGDVSIREYTDYLVAEDIRQDILDSPTREAKNAQVFLDPSTYPTIDMQHPAFVSSLQGLLSATVIIQRHHNGILGLSQNKRSRAMEIGLSNQWITRGRVAVARGRE